MLVLTALGALGCSSLLGLGDFKDAPDGGAAGSSTGGTAGTEGGAGAAGTGGTSDAGDGGLLKCTAVSSVFDLVKPSDLVDDGGAVSIDDEHIRLVVYEADSAVFLAVPYTTADATPGVAVTSVRDGSNPTPNPVVMARVDSAPTGLFRIMDGTIDSTNSTVHLYGALNETPGEVTFPYGGGDQVGAIGQMTPLPDSGACAGASNVNIVFDPTSGRYAMGCQTPTAGTALYVNNGTSTTVVKTSQTDTTKVFPQLYTYEGNANLILSQNGYTRFGSIAADAGTSSLNEGQLDLSTSSADSTLPVYAWPAPTGTTGTGLLVARVNQAAGGGTLFTGVFPTSKYGDIATKHPSELSAIATLDLTNAINFGTPAFNTGRITLAGVVPKTNQVSYWRLGRDGKLLVENYQVPGVSSAHLLRALAAPLGFDDLVVWVQDVGDGGPGSVYIRGEVIGCGQN